MFDGHYAQYIPRKTHTMRAILCVRNGVTSFLLKPIDMIATYNTNDIILQIGSSPESTQNNDISTKIQPKRLHISWGILYFMAIIRTTTLIWFCPFPVDSYRRLGTTINFYHLLHFIFPHAQRFDKHWSSHILLTNWLLQIQNRVQNGSRDIAAFREKTRYQIAHWM